MLLRAWRALKASGAAVLRDGVYLLPEREPCRNTLKSIAADVLSGGETAFLLRVEPRQAAMGHLFVVSSRDHHHAVGSRLAFHCCGFTGMGDPL